MDDFGGNGPDIYAPDEQTPLHLRNRYRADPAVKVLRQAGVIRGTCDHSGSLAALSAMP